MRFAALLCGFGVVAAACGDDASAPVTPGQCVGVKVIAAGADYGGSNLLCGAPGCVQNAQTSSLGLSDDPFLTASNGHVFLLARSLDSVFDVDPACGVATSAVSLGQFAPAGSKANPHGIATDGTTTVVALYNVPRLVFLKNGAVDGDALHLESYDELGGNPYAESVSIVNGKAFVALERLDHVNDPQHPLVSRRPSRMLRVDLATRAVEAAIDLAGRNPFNAMAQLDTALYLAAPGDLYTDGEETAGIERFDTTTSTTSLLVTETAAGGSVIEVAVRAGCGVAIAAAPGAVNPTSLISFDPATGQVFHSFAAPVFGPTAGFDLAGVTWKGDTLYVGDRAKASNGQYPIHAFQLSGACELAETAQGLQLPQPPVGIQASNP